MPPIAAPRSLHAQPQCPTTREGNQRTFCRSTITFGILRLTRIGSRLALAIASGLFACPRHSTQREECSTLTHSSRRTRKERRWSTWVKGLVDFFGPTVRISYGLDVGSMVGVETESFKTLSRMRTNSVRPIVYRLFQNNFPFLLTFLYYDLRRTKR